MDLAVRGDVKIIERAAAMASAADLRALKASFALKALTRIES
jgi:hypothetical protein